MGGDSVTLQKKKIGPDHWVLYDDETGETTPVRDEAALEARGDEPSSVDPI